MVAEFGQQQESCTNFWGSDRTLRSRDRIFEFSQEMVKIFARPHEFWTPAEILTGRASTTSRYSTGEMPPIEAERPEPSDHLRSTYMSENQHIFEDLNESSSARPGGSQQWKILPSPNSKRVPNFSAQILTRRRNFPRRGDSIVCHSSIIRLTFYQVHKFCMSG